MNRRFGYLPRIVSLIAVVFSITLLNAPSKAQAAGGHYTITMNFTPQPAGTLISVEVWGALIHTTNLSNPQYWDGLDYSNIDLQACPASWGALGSGGNAPYISTGNGSPATTITGYNLTCSSITITGDTPSPFVTVWLNNGGLGIANFPVGGSDIVFFDGRINNRAADSYQSVAVYCENGGITAYALYQSKGYLAFKLSKEALAKYPGQPTQNTLIIEKLGVQLYKLTSGEYQVNRTTTDGKLYSFRWKTC